MYVFDCIDKINHTKFFGITAFWYCAAFPLLDMLWKKQWLPYGDEYSKYNEGRRTYILANIMKAGVISFVGTAFIYSIAIGRLNLLNTNNWVNNRTLTLNIMGLYTMTDVIPLFMNCDEMQMSTLVHHVCVGLAHMYVIGSDFRHEGLFKAIVVYGGFSSLASIVNLYLGSRFLIKNKRIKRNIKRMALISYVGSCACNWAWQLFYCTKQFTQLYHSFNPMRALALGLYGVMIRNWIVDDCWLIKHLAKPDK